MTLRKYAMVCSLVTCMTATSAGAGMAVPAPSGSNDNALLAVAIVAIAGMIGWSLTQNGGTSGDPDISSQGSVPGKAKGKVLMEF